MGRQPKHPDRVPYNTPNDETRTARPTRAVQPEYGPLLDQQLDVAMAIYGWLAAATPVVLAMCLPGIHVSAQSEFRGPATLDLSDPAL